MFVPGLSHHVRHRGNNRCDVFLDADDRETFLSILRHSADRHNVAIHGYVLMTTHYHAQVSAADADGLPRMMQSVGRRYVRYFNDRHRRTGTLWEGRYRASLIMDEAYWLNCLRYIEANPVRAGMAADPADYAWSSYQSNALGRHDELLTPHNLYLQLGETASERARTWALMCGNPLSEKDLAHIRTTIQRGAVIRAEEKIATTVRLGSHGRPLKTTVETYTLSEDSESAL